MKEIRIPPTIQERFNRSKAVDQRIACGDVRGVLAKQFSPPIVDILMDRLSLYQAAEEMAGLLV